MTVTFEDLSPFNGKRDGPVYVRHADGTYVSYGPSAALEAVDETKEIQTVLDLQLRLYDEASKPARSFLGEDMLEVKRDGTSGPFTLHVADGVEPDPGPTTSA